MNDIQEALDAIRKAQTNPAGRHWLDVAESFLKRALSSPHPEAREEDIEVIRKALVTLRSFAKQLDCDYQEECTPGCDDLCPRCRAVFIADEALSRLAAQKDEGQTLTVEQVGWLRMVLGRSLYRVEHFPEQSNDEDIEADELAAAIILLGGEPAAPEPRPAEEPDPLDAVQGTAEEHGKQFWERQESAPAAPSDGAIDYELVAYGRFAVALWRCSKHPGGMDWVEAVAKMLREHDAALRSQLARKDEEAELYRRQYDELSAWWRGERPDEEYVGKGHPLEERHARERASLREPDGRKGE